MVRFRYERGQHAHRPKILMLLGRRETAWFKEPILWVAVRKET